ncbi:MAG: M28 family peptidase [Fuerstiella sp.]
MLRPPTDNQTDSDVAQTTQRSRTCIRRLARFASSPHSGSSPRSVTLVVLSVLFLGSPVGRLQVLCADDGVQVAELSADERRAMNVITRGRVLTTVSFLASDEMAGRDTPSPELNIAASYVAARFRGAGLTGLGPDGSFYQTTTLTQTQAPEAPAELQIASTDQLLRLPILAAADQQVSLTGTVLSEDELLKVERPEDDDSDDGPSTGGPSNAIVLIDAPMIPPQALSDPARVLAVCARRVRGLAARGAGIVLMQYDQDSLLPEIAERLRNQPVTARPGLFPDCIVVPVSADHRLTGQTVTVTVNPRRQVEATVHNVVAVRRGSDDALAKQAILISAHLDHIGRSGSGPDPINNGADDNATGVTAVLSLADAFAALETAPERSVIFVAFWGEEKGLLGSRHFVDQPLWPLSDIVANINIEMVGRPESNARYKAWMTGWKHSTLGSIMDAGARRAGVEIFNRTDVGEMLYSRSDNYPFAQRGVIAHSFSAGSLHADYHQPSDEWQKLDIQHMTMVIQGLFAGALRITHGQTTPTAPPTATDEAIPGNQ